MQCVDIPEHALKGLRELERREKLGKIHHQHLDNGNVRIREVFTGTRNKDVLEAMDARLRQLEPLGASNVHRTKIGRNVSCPCGSGRKFKKCCIDKATKVG